MINMRIELFDMDVPYSVIIDTNSDGKDFIMLTPDCHTQDKECGDDKFTINLDYEQAKELMRVLNFLANEIKKDDKNDILDAY